MTETEKSQSLLAPLGVPVFRRIWLASLLSNFGILIQGVGAAWSMSRLTDDITMVALVQTALMFPLMLIALPAGAISDMFDRRLVCIGALVVALVGAVGLCAVTAMGLLTPPILLAFCFVVGSGMALFGPAWQASVSEQVPPEALPSAVALAGMSYNVARSFGPAIGGVIVASVGAIGAFAVNAVFYLPMLAVLLLWKRRHEPPRLSPETFWRAMVSGIRFIRYSPSHRIFILRTVVFGLVGGVIPALMPLIARELLSGGAPVYGVLLGAFGLGALLGAVLLPWIRARFSTEIWSRLVAMIVGAMIICVAFSRSEAVTLAALLVAGAAWTSILTLFTISIQVGAPRWVAGRALSIFQATIAGGVALGAWGWGELADQIGVKETLAVAGALMIGSTLVGFVLRLPEMAVAGANEPANREDHTVLLDLTLRSGPIVITVDYDVPLANARAFYEAMQRVRRSRQASGAYGWSLSRDIADPTLWTERFHSPTWNDYLHLSHRVVGAGVDLQDQSRSLLDPTSMPRVRRMLERPAGSVRWKDETPDRGVDIGPSASAGAP
ncbi:MAG: MFS transporter [Sphingomonadales bacterium 32-64-17]|nr:MAG: MFS transporter [Sphingomonadales bacterium 32-64-17]